MSTQELKIENKADTNKVNYFNVSVLILSIFYLVINYRVFQDLFHKWYAQELTGAYSHGLLVAVIVLYIVFKKIQNIKSHLSVKPSLLGFIILFGAQTLLFVSVISSINFLQHILIVISLLAVIWAVYSYDVAKEFFLPAILFSLTFPVWGDAEYPLQKVSVFLTNILLSLTGLPYYHEQEFFHFPNGIIEIAPECSGFQQLLVSLIIGLLFSMQHKLRVFDTIKTLVYISIAAIFINSIRIIIVMFVGYYTKMESSLVSQHVILGWIVFGIGIYLFLFFYSRIKFKTFTDTDQRNPGKPVTRLTNIQSFKLITILVIFLIFPAAFVPLVTNKINSRDVMSLSYKITSDDWKKTSNALNINWKPEYPTGDALVAAEYVKKNKTIYMYLSNYARLKEGVEPVNMSNKPYNHDYWSPYAHKEIHVVNPAGYTDKLLLDRLISKNNEYLDVLTYFLVNGNIADNIISAKLATLLGFINFKYDVKVVCLAIKSESKNQANEDSLLDFYKNLKIH